MLKEEAIESLKELQARTEQLVEAQRDLEELITRAWRLRVAFSLDGCRDRFVTYRLQAIHEALARLEK